MSLTQIKNQLNYRINAKNQHGLHSPFIFDLTTNVIYERTPFYCYQLIENVRSQLLKDKTQISIKDFGAGSKIFKSNKRAIKDICKHSVKPAKYGQLLFRLVNHFQPQTILELGTCLGVTTSYLHQGQKNAELTTMEGDPSTAKIAIKTLELTRSKAKLVVGKFDDELPNFLASIESLDFAFIDGNHSEAPTLIYFEQCLEKANENSVFVFDDINWSDEMQNAWNKIKAHPKVSITIDLHVMGLVFFRTGVTKQDFIIKY